MMLSNLDIRELEPSRGHQPGRCEFTFPGGNSKGLYVTRESRGRVFVRLAVIDPDSGDMSHVLCLFDTGSELTVIPRTQLATRRAFATSCAPMGMSAMTRGGVVMGSKYPAWLVIPADEESLSLGKVEVMIVESDWIPNYAVLGTNALEKVVSVLDKRALSFWRPCQPFREAPSKPPSP